MFNKQHQFHQWVKLFSCVQENTGSWWEQHCFSNVSFHTTASLSFVHLVIYFHMCLFVLYNWLFTPQGWYLFVIIKLLFPHTCFFSLIAPDDQALDLSVTNSRDVFLFFCLLHPAVTKQIRTQAACVLSLWCISNKPALVLEYSVMLLPQWWWFLFTILLQN